MKETSDSPRDINGSSPVPSIPQPTPPNDITKLKLSDDVPGFATSQTLSPTTPTSPHTEEVIQSSASTVVAFDIEHVGVVDDPRMWPRRRKLITLGVIAFSAIAPTLAVNLYNPAFKQIEKDLHASSSDISLSLSLFIVVQGNAPLFWSAVSEIKGRKGSYIVSMIIFAVGSIVAALAQKISVLIGMRILQAAGSSAVLTLGAGTLADVFEQHERGTIMGIYYAAPLLGPALGPIIGGLLTSAFSWRATFWILVIFAGLAIVTYLTLFRETFRKERSFAYQAALRRATAEQARKDLKKANKALESKLASGLQSPTTEKSEAERGIPMEKLGEIPDLIAQKSALGSTTAVAKDEVKLSLADVNIIGSAWFVIRQRSNAAILLASGLTFAFQYGICYTAAITFAAAPYNYGPIIIGLILLSFGIGCVAGSVLGGRWSDRVLQRLQMEASQRDSEGRTRVSTPEMRLRSTLPVMSLLPPSVVAYAWMCHYHTHIAGPVVMLFIAGFSATWIYSSTLTYIVDANTGRSSTAVATNSSARGIMGLVVAEVSVPLQNAIGDGGLYTGWACLIIVIEAITLLVMYRGASWRAASEAKAAARRAAELHADADAEDAKTVN